MVNKEEEEENTMTWNEKIKQPERQTSKLERSEKKLSP